MTDSATPATPAMTALTRHRGVRRFFLLINCAAVTAVMLAASGCHKDSLSLDESTRPPTAAPDGPVLSPSTETPNIGISSSAATGHQEDSAVTLIITSHVTAPPDGIAVRVRIGGDAEANEFTANAEADCTADLVCTITILGGNRSGNLVLTPISDFSTEGPEPEIWTATLIDGDDYNLNAVNRDAAFAITDLIAAIGIATFDTAAIEGGAIVLTITSSILVTPEDGLEVTVRIGGDVDDADFAPGVCTNPPQCDVVVVIPRGSMSVVLMITPLNDDGTENIERWTATIVPDLNDDMFTVANDVDFSITDPAFPVARNGIELDELDSLAMQPPLAASAIRNRQSDAVGGVAITGSRYDDAVGDPQIFVQRIEFASFAAYVDGQEPTISGFEHDFDYVFLGDDSVNPPSTSDRRGMADYDVEADATYQGVNFFPDGSLTMNFDAGTFNGGFSVRGNSPANYFGDANAMVPDGSGSSQTVAGNDNVDFSVIRGRITADGFESDLTIDTADGFFSALSSFTSASLLGSFYNANADLYDPALGNDPVEIAGAGVIENGGGINDLRFGFLGKCVADCLIGVDIAASSTSVEEGQEINLLVTADAVAPAGDLVVRFRLSGNGLTANDFDTTPANACTNRVCTVTILEGFRSANLVLSPTSDFSDESGERWTASLMDGTNYDAADNADVAFDIIDLVAVVGLSSTDNTAQEGAQLNLVITSDTPAPTGGLNVMFQLSGNGLTEGEYNLPGADCTNFPTCTVTILENERSVNLMLTPLSDFSTEGLEEWTATLDDLGNYDPAANNEIAFDITDLIAVVDIFSTDSGAQEGAQIDLVITSDTAAPTGGLNVMFQLSGTGLTEGEFNLPGADCSTSFPICTVTIPAGSDSVDLVLTPTVDAADDSERWTATLLPASAYNPDAANDEVAFDILNTLPPPPVVDGTLLMALNDYAAPAMPTDLFGNRQGDLFGPAGGEVSITGSRYVDVNDNPQIYVQSLTYANLGIWTDGQEPTIITSPMATASDFDHDFRYAFLGDNAIAGSDFPNGGQARYLIEGDATYRGVNFFVDGDVTANFVMRSFISNIAAGSSTPAFALNHFGSTTARVRDSTDVADDGREIMVNDELQMFASGNINTTNGEFTATQLEGSVATGFFSDLLMTLTLDQTSLSRFSGRFYDSDTYDRTVRDPDELAGAGVFATGTTPGGMDDLHFGFLGKCSTTCDTPNIIGLSSTADSRVQEGRSINLVITSDTPAPMGGFLVMFEISGAIDGEFTLPEADCSTNFPICTVTIPETTDSVNLVLTPTDDTTVEPTENWMVTLMDGTNFIRNPASNAVAFEITDPVPLPVVSNDRILDELNAYDVPDTLTADQIRPGTESSNAGIITGLRYEDVADLPQIYVQLLNHAHLGIWTSGQEPTVNTPGAPSDYDNDFRYATLADSAVSDLPGAGIALYPIEGDATYKGVNFFPDGQLLFHFGSVTDDQNRPPMSYSGSIGVDAGQRLDDFGADDARVPDGTTNGRFLVGGTMGDILTINLVGSINADGTFSGAPTISASGFFADLNDFNAVGTSFSGRFYDATGYDPMTNPRDPDEIAGAGVIEDGTNDLHFGFLGTCFQQCLVGD